MAAITVLTPDYTATPNYAKLETIAITNQTAASTTVSKTFNTPSWPVRYMQIVVDITTMGGTTPTFLFKLFGVNYADTFPPDDADLFRIGAGWDGGVIRTKTGKTTINVGPDLQFDDSGFSAGDETYNIPGIVPQWVAYQYITTDSNDDADYAGTISVYWR